MTAIVAEAWRLTEIRSTGMLIARVLATVAQGNDLKMQRLRPAQGYPVAEQAELEGIPADGRPGELHFRAADEPEYHEALNRGVGGIHRPDDAFLAALERCQRRFE
jgi:hypothetical protein